MLMNNTPKNALFGKGVRNGQCDFDRVEFNELFEFLIDNIYIRFGDCVLNFKQIVGIATYTTWAPFWLIFTCVTMSTIS